MSKDLNIDGIVLAAGGSTRMGKPKALLEIGDTTFLEKAVHLLRDAGCRYVLAVVNDDLWIERLADVAGAAVIINDANNAEQIDSLRLGIANLPDGGDGVLVLPVDCPRVNVETVKAVMTASGDAPVVNPTYNGKAGHPVLFARSVLPELLEPGLDAGARTVIERHAQESVTVAVDDPGILIDIDTPDDYRQHIDGKETDAG